jgi:hypothetical protein
MAYIWKIKILQDFIDNVYLPDSSGRGRGVPALRRDRRRVPEPAGLTAASTWTAAAPDYTRRERLFKQEPSPPTSSRAKLDTNKITELRPALLGTRTRPPGAAPLARGHKAEIRQAGSFIPGPKAPRYDGQVYEVGPLARVASDPTPRATP